MGNRITSLKKNLFFEFISHFLIVIFPFITKTIFIKLLGEEYLGISGLFTSILTILNLTELGITNVTVFSMYEPVAKNNYEKIVELLEFYKKLYIIIAAITTVLGLSFLPFLDIIINTDSVIPHLKIYYLLFLANSVFSYFYVYKSTVLIANQQQYIKSMAKTIFNILMQIAQIIILLIYKSYILYLLIQVIFVLINNLYLSYKSDKLYPYIKTKPKSSLPIEQKKRFFSDTLSMMSYKIGGSLLNSTDSIFISKLINLATVGYYSNYISLKVVMDNISNILTNALTGIIGNLSVDSSENIKKQSFDLVSCVFNSVAIYIAIGFYCVSSDIIKIWIGEKYVIDNYAVMALTINIYLPIVLNAVWIFRNATGVFRKTKNILLYSAALNIVFSWFLGMKMGLSGILFATSLSRLLTSFWFEPVVLYREIFPNSSVKEYFIEFGKNAMIIVICVMIIEFINGFISISFCGVILEMIVCVVITTIILIIFNIKNKNFISAIKLFIKKS